MKSAKSSTKRTASSRNWLQRQNRDPYVAASRRDGYRSRAAYKLLELQAKYKILRPGMLVVDLGAAPGSWSQVVSQLVCPQGAGQKHTGKVFALDILDMAIIPGVEFLQADFTCAESVLEFKNLVLSKVGSAKLLDSVLSDMAPNFSGVKAVDIDRAFYLAEQALDFALQLLKPTGSFVTKVFQGAGFDEYLRSLKTAFKVVKSFKPQASRSESREIYLLAYELRKN